MAANYYLGSPSMMAGMNSSMVGSPQSNMTAPIMPGIGDSQPVSPQQYDPNAAQAIRPIGDTKGYDPNYLQNLATYMGGIFKRPQQNGPMQFNPLGDLKDIPGAQPLGGGTAPLFGLPQTLLQFAQSGIPTGSSAPAGIAAPPGVPPSAGMVSGDRSTMQPGSVYGEVDPSSWLNQFGLTPEQRSKLI